MLFGSDLINIQIIYANLDAVAMTAGQLIVEKGAIDNEIMSFVRERANASIVCVNNCTPRFGDTYTYNVATLYDTIIMSQESLELSITRSVVIGYYNWKERNQMSEIKGQLLGVLLVVTIFAGVSAVLVTAFSDAASDVAEQISAPAETTPAANINESNFTIHYEGL